MKSWKTRLRAYALTFGGPPALWYLLRPDGYWSRLATVFLGFAWLVLFAVLNTRTMREAVRRVAERDETRRRKHEGDGD